MTLIDSMDSILMLYSYSGFPEKSWRVLERSSRSKLEQDAEKQLSDEKIEALPELNTLKSVGVESSQSPDNVTEAPESLPNSSREIDLDTKVARDTQVKMNVMSGLSIILTLMSILVAFRYVKHPFVRSFPRLNKILQYFFNHNYGINRR